MRHRAQQREPMGCPRLKRLNHLSITLSTCLAEVSFRTMMGLMFLKGCLCTVPESPRSLNAEITISVFYASVVPHTGTSANNWEEEREGRWASLMNGNIHILLMYYKHMEYPRALVCVHRRVGASHDTNPEIVAK